MELVAYIDFHSANAWLALNPTRRLALETGLAIDWRPFSRRPKLRRGTDPASQAARHAGVRAAYRRREAAFYAEQQGIALVYPDLEQEGFAANAGLAWLRHRFGAGADRCDTYVSQVFAEVWSGALDTRDRAAVSRAVDTAGGDSEGFDAWFDEHAEEVLASHRRQALDLGVVDVPGYVAAGEPFVGRANLPIVRWLLTGGRSTA